MKSIVIASNCSGGGKTTFTLGLIKAFINRGYDVCGFKVGPDYIDTDFQNFLTKNDSRNLDVFMMGEEGVLESYNRAKGDVGVIEGVMGLYDGAGIYSEGSTYHISKILDLPIILVITPKAQSTTIAAEILGLIKFKNANIQGVVFNKVSDGYFKLLKEIVEKNIGVKVLGYIPNDDKIVFESRHLGLVQAAEIEGLEDKIDSFCKVLEKYVDIDYIANILKEGTIKKDFKEDFGLKRTNLKIGVAYDKAFRFYYKENIEMLKCIGEVVYFSPLEDKCLPKDINFLYIGGGYPEVFKEELSQNKSMLEDISKKLQGGLNCYAECGGLMYLTKEIDGVPMVGFFDGETVMTNTLNNFGYAKLTVSKENNKIKKGLSVNCHEFHKSKVNLKENTIYELKKDLNLSNDSSWKCGYVKNNTLGAYAHVHFLGNINFLKEILGVR